MLSKFGNGGGGIGGSGEVAWVVCGCCSDGIKVLGDGCVGLGVN